MKDLNEFGVQEIEIKKLKIIEGGEKASYLGYHWGNYDNELMYAAEAVWNLGVLTANGGIWVYNQFQ